MRLKASIAISTSFALGLGGYSIAAPVSAGTPVAIQPGGYVEVPVPSGKATTLAIGFEDVVDEKGSVATFRVEVMRNSNIVGARFVNMREPGGQTLQHFRRPFDRVRIRDNEGSVTATIDTLNFCRLSLSRQSQCTTVNGGVRAQNAERVV
ncbi:MAG: hypothetical protein AAF723_08185, partial [Pseudomonadota bacterium]